MASTSPAAVASLSGAASAGASLLPPPAERRQRRPFLKSRTFAEQQGGADGGPIGVMVRQSLATSERLDTVCVALSAVASMQALNSATNPNASTTAAGGPSGGLQKAVAERLDRLERIYERLAEGEAENGSGADGNGCGRTTGGAAKKKAKEVSRDVTLRFLPGELVPELDALVREKEHQLGLALRHRRGAADLPLCDAFLRGECTRGVTCGYSHDHERLATYVRRWLTAVLRMPMDEDGEPTGASVEGGVDDDSALGSPFHASAVTSEPPSARGQATGRNTFGSGAASACGRHASSGAVGGASSVAQSPPAPPRRAPTVQSVLTVDETFGPEAWSIILRSLGDYPHVTALVLRQMPPQAFKTLAALLQRNELDRIAHVDVGRNSIGAVYPQGILRLAKALLYNTSVTTLGLGFNKLGAAGALALTQALCDGGGAVEALSLASNGLSPADPAYEHWCGLIGKAGIGGVRRLSVAGNRLGGDGAALLLSALSVANGYSSLTHLDLYHVGLGDMGCKALAGLLSSSAAGGDGTSGPHICLLNIGWNGITAAGLQLICHALEAHTCLQVLRLHGNPLMGRKGAIALSLLLKAAPNLPLTTLDLRWTSPTDDGVASIAEAIVGARYLTTVLVGHNDLDARSEALIVEKLRKRPVVAHVDAEVAVTPEDEVW